MANRFTDLVKGNGSKPVDFDALAGNCFAGAAQGRSNQQIAAANDQIAGIAGQGRNV